MHDQAVPVAPRLTGLQLRLAGEVVALERRVRSVLAHEDRIRMVWVCRVVEDGDALDHVAETVDRLALAPVVEPLGRPPEDAALATLAGRRTDVSAADTGERLGHADARKHRLLRRPEREIATRRVRAVEIHGVVRAVAEVELH